VVPKGLAGEWPPYPAGLERWKGTKGVQINKESILTKKLVSLC